MKVSYEYDQDPRYGWASIDTEGDKNFLIVVHTEDGSTGYVLGSGGLLVPTCLCSAWDASECACGHYGAEYEITRGES